MVQNNFFILAYLSVGLVFFLVVFIAYTFVMPYFRKTDGGLIRLPIGLKGTWFFIDEQYGECEILSEPMVLGDGDKRRFELKRKGDRNSFCIDVYLSDIQYITEPARSMMIIKHSRDKIETTKREIRESEMNALQQRRIAQDLDYNLELERITDTARKLASASKTDKKDEK